MELYDILLDAYKEKHWEEYASCFKDEGIRVEGIPQDIVNAVTTVLGEKAGITWLDTPLHALDEKTARELLQTENGEKVLKAFIMRLPN